VEGGKEERKKGKKERKERGEGRRGRKERKEGVERRSGRKEWKEGRKVAETCSKIEFCQMLSSDKSMSSSS
jgi:hypothetical protein